MSNNDPLKDILNDILDNNSGLKNTIGDLLDSVNNLLDNEDNQKEKIFDKQTFKINETSTRDIRAIMREKNLKIVDEEINPDGTKTYYLQKRDDIEGENHEPTGEHCEDNSSKKNTKPVNKIVRKKDNEYLKSIMLGEIIGKPKFKEK